MSKWRLFTVTDIGRIPMISCTMVRSLTCIEVEGGRALGFSSEDGGKDWHYHQCRRNFHRCECPEYSDSHKMMLHRHRPTCLGDEKNTTDQFLSHRLTVRFCLPSLKAYSPLQEGYGDGGVCLLCVLCFVILHIRRLTYL